MLQQPLLYTSLYLKQYRDEYYKLLQRVREEGVWEEWIDFFARGVIATAEKAVQLADNIFELFRRDELKLKGHGARMGSALQVFQQMQKTPYTTANTIGDEDWTQSQHGSVCTRNTGLDRNRA